jgi:hypothetical protein
MSDPILCVPDDLGVRHPGEVALAKDSEDAKDSRLDPADTFGRLSLQGSK